MVILKIMLILLVSVIINIIDYHWMVILVTLRLVFLPRKKKKKSKLVCNDNEAKSTVQIYTKVIQISLNIQHSNVVSETKMVFYYETADLVLKQQSLRKLQRPDLILIEKAEIQTQTKEKAGELRAKLY